MSVSQNTDQKQNSGFHPVYMAELLFKERPVFREEKLMEVMRRMTGNARVLKKRLKDGAAVPVGTSPSSSVASETEEQEPLVIMHTEFMVPFEDGTVPAQTCILPVHEITDKKRFKGSLEQSWHWKEATGVIGDCKYQLRIHDLFTAALPHKERLQLFQQALSAVLEVVPCDALYFYGSDKIVEPAAYTKALQDGDHLYGAMNVRLYQAGGTEARRELVMDTVGLSSLGVPDFQCHFSGLDPDQVAQTLFGAAYYLFDQGDVILDGQLLGTADSQRWRCEHQESIVSPRRYVIDLDPGSPYYAGQIEP
ncbi:DUF4261 domain-containing protein [Paenibacillus gallinarum]|uniref:DUF4261 domain-containing protein n=1 Tax=Paenibacillus gallinarum TaxID=2762232 RepID=A0ABR8SUB1_9BACL|nr:DUF4261 domain-containing protein [Paenibacillus gallinarum]MBD7967032.1 DUF4261 domain-containing protein [Paenibacillus gallinarum]